MVQPFGRGRCIGSQRRRLALYEATLEIAAPPIFFMNLKRDELSSKSGSCGGLNSLKASLIPRFLRTLSSSPQDQSTYLRLLTMCDSRKRTAGSVMKIPVWSVFRL